MSDINKKKDAKKTDKYKLNDFIYGSLSARNPQIKNSIYDSIDIETIVFKIFYISY